MKILITGGTGFIGRALVERLVSSGNEVTVLGRHIPRLPHKSVIYHAVDVGRDTVKLEWLLAQDAIIHLAGAPIIGRRWTKKYREQLVVSRVGSAQKIVEALGRLPKSKRPRVVVSASAIGFYGDTGDRIVDENDIHGNDFLAGLCRQWEQVWKPAEKLGIRVVSLRTGIVIDESGGMLKTIRPLFSRYLGVVLGNGKQWVSWISRDDLVSVYQRAVTDSHFKGSINAVAPTPYASKEFMQRLAARYGAKVFLRVPAWVIRTALGGASDVVLFSQRVEPKTLIDKGFVFEHDTL